MTIFMLLMRRYGLICVVYKTHSEMDDTSFFQLETVTRIKTQYPKTIVLYPVHTVVSTVEVFGEDADIVSALFNLYLGYSDKYGARCGFPIDRLEQYIRELCKNGWTVVIVDNGYDTTTIEQLRNYK